MDLNKSKQKEKIITVFLFTALLFALLYVYFAQERLYSSLTTGSKDLGNEKYLRIVSVIFIFITTFISIFAARSKYRVSIFFTYLLLLISVTFNYFLSGANAFDMSQVMSNKGIGTWICLGLIFVGYHDKRYELFQKFIFFSILFISALCFYNFYDFGVGLWRGQALSKYQVYAVNFVWTIPYIFLSLKYNVKLKWLRIGILFMGIIVALITQTRSFLIIFLITILFDFYNTKNKTSYLVIIIGGFIGLIYLVLNTKILSTSLELPN